MKKREKLGMIKLLRQWRPTRRNLRSTIDLLLQPWITNSKNDYIEYLVLGYQFDSLIFDVLKIGWIYSTNGNFLLTVLIQIL